MSALPANIGKVAAVRRELLIKIQREGLAGTLKLGAAKIFRLLQGGSRQEIHPFDLKYGTDTSSIVEVGALDLPPDQLRHAVRYQTAIAEVFTELLCCLPIRHEEFVFVDLGSGKGRALLMASNLPFKEIVGVELSPRLHGIACRNIEIFREPAQRCGAVRSVCEDATRFRLPPENLVIYLFNPFDEEIMGAVAANIEASLREKPRKIYIMYLKPVHRTVFDRADFLEIWKQTERYVIYRGVEKVPNTELGEKLST